MARSYSLDTKAATAADTVFSRIDETGKYIGTITRAEVVTAPKGTEGIEFSFRDDSGANADYLTVWTYDKDGKELSGLKAVNALMTVLRAKTLTPTQGKVEKWDKNSGARKEMPATIFPELTNKRVGFLLQMEEYQKTSGDGGIGKKMNIYAVFDPETELTASEILARKTTPETLEKLLSGLRDKPLKGSKRQSTEGYSAGNSGGADGDPFDDDDIPF